MDEAKNIILKNEKHKNYHDFAKTTIWKKSEGFETKKTSNMKKKNLNKKSNIIWKRRDGERDGEEAGIELVLANFQGQEQRQTEI